MRGGTYNLWLQRNTNQSSMLDILWTHPIRLIFSPIIPLLNNVRRCFCISKFSLHHGIIFFQFTAISRRFWDHHLVQCLQYPPPLVAQKHSATAFSTRQLGNNEGITPFLKQSLKPPVPRTNDHALQTTGHILGDLAPLMTT